MTGVPFDPHEFTGAKPDYIVVNDHIGLRELTLADSQDYFELIDRNREHLSKHGDDTSEKYPTLEAVQERAAEYTAGEHRFGICAEDGTLLGLVKLTEVSPECTEVGYWLDEQHQGSGIMVDSVKAVCDLAINKLRYKEVIAWIEEHNDRSQAVVRRLGFEQVDPKYNRTRVKGGVTYVDELFSYSEVGLENLEDGRVRLSDGRLATNAELDQALQNYFETAQLKEAESRARLNRQDLTMLYNAIARASRSGKLLRNPDELQGVMADIDHEHGEVMAETFSGAVADVEHLSAVTLAALMPEIDAIEKSYKELHQQGVAAQRAVVRSSILVAPSFIEGVTPKNFVQAMIVASIVKWIPLRGYHDGKRFFVTPASKDWDVLRRLERTEEGQDWIDIAYARSEHDSDDILPD